MNTTTASPILHCRRAHGKRERFPYRATPAEIIAPTQPGWTSTATHDFLVPNPRPDLTCDPQTLAMIDRPSA